MNNLKKLLLAIIMLSFACGIDFFSCDEVKNDDYTKAKINTPTNDYQVAVEIYSLGGITGCTTASISINDEAVTDAELIINEVTIECDTLSEYSPMYFDTSTAISYLEHTEYEMEIRHNGETIATGNAIVPSTPEITNLTAPYTHELDKSLTVEWTKIEDATAIEFYIYQDFGDENEIDTILSPLKTSITVPASFFNGVGDYYISIVAYNGLNADMDLDDYVDNDGNFTKSINMSGAAGIFTVMNMYPADEDFLIQIVDEESLKKPIQSTKPARDFREILKSRHQRQQHRFGF